MTTRLSIILALIIIGLLAVDVLILDSINQVFLGKKFFALINWLAFWR